MKARTHKFLAERAKRAAFSADQTWRAFMGEGKPAPAPLTTLEERARKLWLAMQNHDEEERAKAHSFFAMCGDDLRAEVMKLAGANDKFQRPRNKLKYKKM